MRAHLEASKHFYTLGLPIFYTFDFSVWVPRKISRFSLNLAFVLIVIYRDIKLSTLKQGCILKFHGRSSSSVMFIYIEYLEEPNTILLPRNFDIRLCHFEVLNEIKTTNQKNSSKSIFISNFKYKIPRRRFLYNRILCNWILYVENIKKISNFFKKNIKLCVFSFTGR